MTGGMEITLRDVYDSQQATRTDVATLGAKFESLQATVNLQLSDGRKRMDDHEDRLRLTVTREDHEKLEARTERLESLAGRVIGIGLTAMFFGAMLAAVVGALTSHYLK